MRSLLITAAVVAGLVAAPATGAATTRGLPPVMTPAATNLFPEGVAWDPTRQSLLVGSQTHPGTISAVGRDGVARPVVTDPAQYGFVGLKVDAHRNRIVAAIGNPFAPGPSFLAIYDLRTGAPRQLVDLSGEGHAVNDVALDPSGNAYVTDTAAGAVYKVDVAGHVTTLVSDPERLTPAPGANGIVWHPGGYLVVGNYTTGKLYRLSRGHLTELRGPSLVGADGMVLRPDGTLVVVTNRLNSLPGSVVAVHELALVGNRLIPLHTTSWPDASPTTAAVTPYGTYVVDGHLDAWSTGGTASNFVLRRL